MNKDEFKDDLVSDPIQFLASKWILERVPVLFGPDNLLIWWKQLLAGDLGVARLHPMLSPDYRAQVASLNTFPSQTCLI